MTPNRQSCQKVFDHNEKGGVTWVPDHSNYVYVCVKNKKLSGGYLTKIANQ